MEQVKKDMLINALRRLQKLQAEIIGSENVKMQITVNPYNEAFIDASVFDVNKSRESMMLTRQRWCDTRDKFGLKNYHKQQVELDNFIKYTRELAKI